MRCCHCCVMTTPRPAAAHCTHTRVIRCSQPAIASSPTAPRDAPFAGFSPLGHTRVQFMIWWQRYSLNSSSSARNRSLVAASRESAIQRYACGKRAESVRRACGEGAGGKGVRPRPRHNSTATARRASRGDRSPRPHTTLLSHTRVTRCDSPRNTHPATTHLHEHRGPQVLVRVPPVARAARGAARAQDALVHAVQLLAVHLRLAVLRGCRRAAARRLRCVCVCVCVCVCTCGNVGWGGAAALTSPNTSHATPLRSNPHPLPNAPRHAPTSAAPRPPAATA